MTVAVTTLFVSCAKGLEELLARELALLGARATGRPPGGVPVEADLATAYRICLWSRLASRVLLPLAHFPVTSAADLYAGVRALDWSAHLPPPATFAVSAVGTAPGLHHSRYAALRVKDAVVDRLRDERGERPSVDVRSPDLALHLHLKKGFATLSLDLSGESLDRRGYRLEHGLAPLRETLAAAVLLRAGWPELAAAGGGLVDPCCGAGTLVLEAAMIACDRAPGLRRERFGFSAWPGHRPELWRALVAEAEERFRRGAAGCPPLFGFDADPRAVRAAEENLRLAALPPGRIRFAVQPLDRLENPLAGAAPGLVVTNPPYGQRLGDASQLGQLYERLGDRLRAAFGGWRTAILCGDPVLARATGIRPERSYRLFNGALPVTLDCGLVWAAERSAGVAERRRAEALASPFANRLRKNLKALAPWVRSENLDCYRLYDADIPEYAVAVDRYGEWLHVQEYAPPPTVDARQARRRLREVATALSAELAVPPERIVLKQRRRQRGGAQYERQAARGEFLEVGEGPARLLVNLHDYLDTGLFLDHRPIRAWLRAAASGLRVLNLFAYTCTATVHAALGGASATTSVDLSRTYLDWGRRNLELNGLRTGAAHRLIRADVLPWLAACRERFDLIFVDPPSYSRSKGMERDFDVQRDHVALLTLALARLAPGGLLCFSTNLRSFRLDREALAGSGCEEITPRTIPRDFARDPRIHQCWLLHAAPLSPVRDKGLPT